MHIGLISNSDLFIPLAHTLAVQQAQVSVFYRPSQRPFVNERAEGFAKQSGLSFTTEKDAVQDVYSWLKANTFDSCFVIGYPRLLKVGLLVPTPVFNIHFSPLPAFRGPLPLFWQLKAGVSNLGLVIHRLTSKFDEGAVVWQKEIENQPIYNHQSANQILSQVCIEGVFHILGLLLNKMPVPDLETTRQPSYQRRPQLADVLIDWKNMSAIEICNLVRACNPWNKGAVSSYKREEIKLLDARVAAAGPDAAEPGTIIFSTDRFFITCRDQELVMTGMIYFRDSFLADWQLQGYGFRAGDVLG